MCDAANLSREAIIRIRAGENPQNVQDEVDTGLDSSVALVGKVWDKPYKLEGFTGDK